MTRKERKEMKAQLREWVFDLDWIEQQEYARDKEYLEVVKDIFENKVFQSMSEFVQHGDTSCLAHSIQVSYLSFCICRSLGMDARSAARAGLLHDLFLYDWHTHAKETGRHFHGFTHPRTALINASREFELNDIEKNCILRHMWPLTPIPPKYKEGYVIVYADKYCSTAEVCLRIQQSVKKHVLGST